MSDSHINIADAAAREAPEQTGNGTAPQREKGRSVAVEDRLAALNRQLPFSTEAESGVLSCLLQEPSLITDCRQGLPRETFYHTPSGLVYGALLAMEQAGLPIDVVSVSNWMRDTGTLDRAGGSSAISELYTFVPISAHYPYYRRIVLRKYHLRLGIAAMAENLQELQNHGAENPDAPVTDVLSDCEQRVFNVLNIAQEAGGQGQVWDSREMSRQWADVMEKIYRSRGAGIKGIATGMYDLDRAFGGLSPDEDGDMLIVAGYPGNGKSAFGATLLENIAVEQGVPTAVFPLEMGRVGIAHRLYLGAAGVPVKASRSGFLAKEDWGPISRAVEEIGAKPIFWDWSNSITHSDLHARVKVLVRKHGVKCVIIDHFGHVKPTSKGGLSDPIVGQREVMETLHAMRRELGILVILLVQMNKAARDTPVNQAPNLGSLRGASEIGEMATHAVFLHRPCLSLPFRTLGRTPKLTSERQKDWAEKVDYYRIKFPEAWAPMVVPDGWEERGGGDDDDDSFTPSPWHYIDYEEHTIANVAKNRHGATPDNVCLRFDLGLQRFRNRTTAKYSNNADYRQVELAGF